MVEIERDDNGRFKKGSPSPNPAGRGNSKGMVAYIRSISNDTQDYIDILDSMIRNNKTKNSDKISCIKELLDRIYGKASQHNINENHDKTPYSKVIELVNKRITDDNTK